MISAIISRLVILLFGTLYPAYSSYKAVRTKNVKEYVKWMMYWIVYAFFTCIETFTDIFLSWFPFYYEIKVIIVIWLLSPATKGSSTLYRKFVHPMLTRREQEIDEYLNQAKEKGYTAVLQLGSKGVNYATNVIMQTALKTIGAQDHRHLIQSNLLVSSHYHNDNRISSDYDDINYYGEDRTDNMRMTTTSAALLFHTRSLNDAYELSELQAAATATTTTSATTAAASSSSYINQNNPTRMYNYLDGFSDNDDDDDVADVDMIASNLNVPTVTQLPNMKKSKIKNKRKNLASSTIIEQIENENEIENNNEEEQHDEEEQSAARIREQPKRKIIKKCLNRIPIRGRRRLREPSVDVDIE